MAASHTVTWPVSRAWWVWLWRESQVVRMAMPALPPRLRTTLKMPVAVAMRATGIVARLMVVRGTNTSPIPSPWTKRDQVMVQKSAPRLRDAMSWSE